jgi:hypothetical protein
VYRTSTGEKKLFSRIAIKEAMHQLGCASGFGYR